MIKPTNFTIRLPDDIKTLPINEEYFFITQNGEERRLRLHYYNEVYSIPGLYEYIAMEILKYRSPQIMSSLLVEKVTETGLPIDQLKVLELGAGSGLFGKALAKLGVTFITGIDIVPEAKIATHRECPGVYQDYFVEDLTQLSESTKNRLKEQKLNCLVCCSALSSDHIPVQAFKVALSLIQEGGWVMFNIAKSSYENPHDSSKFINFYRQAIAEETLKLHYSCSYIHRHFFNGQTLEYIAILAKKQGIKCTLS